MSRVANTVVRVVTVVAGVAALAACSTPPPPPPPPPPPRPVVIPPKPLPPSGATPTMTIPSVGVDGVRQTVNTNLSPAQITWNLRSALNVAALNCLSARHAAILPAYKSFLTRNVRKLAATNKTLKDEFRKKYGATYSGVQDAYMTQVYNYFALPPALSDFCDTAQVVGTETLTVPSDGLDAYAAQALPRLEAVFEKFFKAYEQYRVELAAWNAQYGATGGQPAVATYPMQTSALTSTQSATSLPTQGPIFKSGEALRDGPSSPASDVPPGTKG